MMESTTPVTVRGRYFWKGDERVSSQSTYTDMRVSLTLMPTGSFSSKELFISSMAKHREIHLRTTVSTTCDETLFSSGSSV
jgi:hypothetical protein